MRSKWKWILLILPLLVALLLILGRYTIPLPYFLSGSMERYLLEIPEGENAKELILSHCEETFSEVIGETEYQKYSYDEAALMSLLPEEAAMYQVESANSVVFFYYELPDDILVTLAYDDSGWNHSIIKYERTNWMFTHTRDSFKLYTPWVRFVS